MAGGFSERTLPWQLTVKPDFQASGLCRCPFVIDVLVPLALVDSMSSLPEEKIYQRKQDSQWVVKPNTYNPFKVVESFHNHVVHEKPVDSHPVIQVSVSRLISQGNRRFHPT